VTSFQPSQAQPDRHRPRRYPPWFSPPENELGVVVPVDLALARTDELALALLDVTAYSNGFVLRLGLRLHPDALRSRGLTQIHGGLTGGGEEHLLCTIEFADGRHATNAWSARPPGGEALPISVQLQSGRGGGLSFDAHYWVFPLPPPGPITLAIEWPARGIAAVRHELDAGAILDAAGRSEPLWEDDRPIGRRPAPTTGEIRF
jgi:hypothetical protein